MTMYKLVGPVCEAVSKLLSEDELSSFTLSRRPPESWQYLNPEVLLWLTLSVGDEEFVLPLVQVGVRETEDQLIARVQSALQDWIAESKFGWGEQRGPS